MKGKWRKEIIQLQQQGVISSQVAEQIEHYYRQQRRRPIPILPALFVLSALSVGVGFVLLVAYNWNQIPRLLRLAAAFSPLISCQIGLFFCRKRPLTSDIILVLLFFALGGTLALVGQIYQLETNVPDFLLSWLLLSLPLLLFFHSMPLFLFLLFLQLMNNLWTNGYDALWGGVARLGLPLAFFLAFAIWQVPRRALVWRILCSWSLLIVTCVFLFSYGVNSVVLPMLIAQLFEQLHRQKGPQSTPSLVYPFVVGRLALLALFLLAQHELGLDFRWSNTVDNNRGDAWGIISLTTTLAVLATVLLVFLYQFYRWRQRLLLRPWQWCALPCLLIIYLLKTNLTEQMANWGVVILFTVTLSFLSVHDIVGGYRQTKEGRFAWGILVATSQILVYILRSDIGLLTRSTFLLALGAAIFASGMVMRRIKRSQPLP